MLDKLISKYFCINRKQKTKFPPTTTVNKAHDESDNKPDEIVVKRFKERIESCEQKCSHNLKWMNRFKFCRVLAGVLAVFFVSLLAAEGFEDSTKFYLNMFAILCTTLTAFSSNILTDFGWENRFKQNMRSLGELRTLETKYKMEKSLLEEPTEIDYRHWNSNIDKVLGGQAATFEEEFQRAVQSK